MWSEHPFLNSGYSTSLGNNFPPQMLPLSKKDDDWRKRNMDCLEAIARIQYWENLPMMENYKMLHGEFLSYQYEDVDENKYIDLLQYVREKFEVPKRVRHFDFISQVVNALVGELDGNPDIFRVVAKGEAIEEARERERTRLLNEYITQKINQEIEGQLVKQGLDPNKQDFNSPEEQQQYQQQIEQAKQTLTPTEIQRYMDTEWRHIAEIWANAQLEVNKERYRLDEKERIEFIDMLTVDRCFRHFRLTGRGYEEETWNTKQVFFHKSPDVYEVERGNYAGRLFFASLADVIDRYGHLLTGDELEELHGDYPKGSSGDIPLKDWFGNSISYLDPYGLPYRHRIPTENAWLMNAFPQVSQSSALHGTNVPMMTELLENNYRTYINHMFQITEGYWKSQRKVGKLFWLNPATGIEEKIIVDENFVVPPYIKVIEGNLYPNTDRDELNTIQWTWINEVWGGIKLTPLGGLHRIKKPLYLNVNPLDFQGRSDGFQYDPLLPVVGQIFNNRNAISQSLVDVLKPYQIAFNMFINQAYLMAQEEILPFMLMDSNNIPQGKDWGGPDGFEKWATAIREGLRIAPAETRPVVTGGANAGGQMPMVVDMDITSRMLSRFELALRVKQLGLEQVGVTPQRLGDIKATETATGVTSAQEKSYTQTSSYFTKFYQYKRRCLQMSLNFAQFVQSKEKDGTISLTHSDHTNTFIKINGTDLLLADLHIYATSSQEEKRKLDLIKQLGLENNTMLTSMSDRITMMTTNSVAEIQSIIRQSETKMEQQKQQEFQQQQQQIEQQLQLQREQQAFEAEQNQLDRENKLEEAYIKTFGYREDNNMADNTGDGSPDIMEYAKLKQKTDADSAKQHLAEQKRLDDQLKLLVNQQQHTDKLNLAKEEMNLKREQMKNDIKQAKILGDKSR